MQCSIKMGQSCYLSREQLLLRREEVILSKKLLVEKALVNFTFNGSIRFVLSPTYLALDLLASRHEKRTIASFFERLDDDKLVFRLTRPRITAKQI